MCTYGFDNVKMLSSLVAGPHDEVKSLTTARSVRDDVTVTYSLVSFGYFYWMYDDLKIIPSSSLFDVTLLRPGVPSGTCDVPCVGDCDEVGFCPHDGMEEAAAILWHAAYDFVLGPEVLVYAFGGLRYAFGLPHGVFRTRCVVHGHVHILIPKPWGHRFSLIFAFPIW